MVILSDSFIYERLCEQVVQSEICIQYEQE